MFCLCYFITTFNFVHSIGLLIDIHTGDNQILQLLMIAELAFCITVLLYFAAWARANNPETREYLIKAFFYNIFERLLAAL